VVKRILFSIIGTVASLAALLGFKSTTATPLTGGAMPSAALGAPGGAATDPATPDTPTNPTNPTTPPPAPQPGSQTTPPVQPQTGSKTITGAVKSNQYGEVQVQVTVSGQQITNVQFVKLTAYDRRSSMINNAAGPLLLQQTLQAQSARIHGVSGATYTSQSYVESLQSALDKM
jgi:uncharacterized protein with FMN-binding domain